MFQKGINKAYKVVNGFYMPCKAHSDLKIGMQNLNADRIYIYLYNSKTRKHEGQWCYPKELLERGKEYDDA